jgi:hypothetical protein
MTVEARQQKLHDNAEAMERWMKKLLRAAHEIEKLRAQRKRLLGKPSPRAIKYRSLEAIREAAEISGTEFNDEIPS